MRWRVLVRSIRKRPVACGRRRLPVRVALGAMLVLVPLGAKASAETGSEEAPGMVDRAATRVPVARPGVDRADQGEARITMRGVHIRLHGELHCGKQVADLRSAIDEAIAADRGAIVLDCSLPRYRPDLLIETVELLQRTRERLVNTDSKTQRPVRVYVVIESDREGIASGSAAALALVADGAVIRPNVKIRSANDVELPAPLVGERGGDNGWNGSGGSGPGGNGTEATPWAGTEEAVAARARVQAALAAACGRRGIGVELTELLPRPVRAAWWLADDPWAGGAARVVMEPPGAESDFAWGVLAGPAGGDERTLSLAIDAKVAERIGLARIGSGSVTQMLGTFGVVCSNVTRVEIRADLGSARTRVRSALEEVDRRLRDVRADLRESTRSRRQEDRWRGQRAGERALAQLTAIESAIEGAERELLDYPELLAEPPPGATPVGQTAERLPGEWRRVLQAHRDSAAEIRAQARALTQGRAG